MNPGIGGRSLSLIETLNDSPREIRKFGYLFAGVGVVAAAFLFWKGNPGWRWVAGFALLFLLGGALAPSALRPVYRIWMRFAFVLAWINTRVLLTLFFLLVITPVGVIMRLCGRDILDRRIDRARRSYWSPRNRDRVNPERYENLF
jgi:hypothetical protein